MNVISNDCVGAYLYRDCFKCDYKNPFIWSSIDFDNFLRLYEDYDTIDFSSYKCDVIVNNSGICKQGSLTPKVIIDNKIEINYFHYIQDNRYKKPTRSEGYTLIDNVAEYALQNYRERLKFMTETPVFIWDVTSCKWYNKTSVEPVKLFTNSNSKYQLIIHSNSVNTETTGKITMIHKTNSSFEVDASARNIYEKVLKGYEG